MALLSDFIKDIFHAWRPPPRLTLSEWADKYGYLSAESSAEAGKWHTISYQKGMMDAFTDPTVEQITVMKSARVGYTKIINMAIGYHIHHDPCTMMVVQPTIEDAEGYSKEELSPMIRDTPVLRNLVSDAKTRDKNNTILQKNFPAGTISMVGANSPRGFRRVSRRIVLFDEVDGYPPSAGTEGDQIKLGIRRTEYYWNRKIVAGSTPTVDELSRVQKMFNESDQRRYFVPCPHCDHPQYLKFGGKNDKFGLKWPEGEPHAAYYVCEKNGCIIDHSHKKWMCDEAARRQKADPTCKYGWIPTAPGNGKHAGFHIWAAYSYSPNASWGDLAAEFLDAKEDPLKLKTFVNTVLGECWAESYSAKLGAEAIAERAEEYQLMTVPMRGLILTAAIDVQDNRLAIVVRAWGEDEESWLIYWAEIHGDPADLSASGPWAQIDSILLQEFPHESGAKMRVRAAAVDTGGHFTHEAYMFCRTRKSRHVLAIKGMNKPGRPPLAAKPSRQDINYKNQMISKGVELWMVGTDTIKETLFARLKIAPTDENPNGAGMYHFPLGISQDYFKQLTAEKQIIKYRNGHSYRTWFKKDGARNEALDCEVYNYAVLQYIYTRTSRATIWLQAKSKLGRIMTDKDKSPDDEKPDTPEPPPPPPPIAARRQAQAARRRKTGFVNKYK